MSASQGRADHTSQDKNLSDLSNLQPFGQVHYQPLVLWWIFNDFLFLFCLLQKAPPVRHLNLLEHQSKTILDSCGVAVQKFVVVDSPAAISSTVSNFNVAEYVVKAQVHAGGRGKGHFDTGFKGGVHILTDQSKVPQICKEMLGNKLITKQTPPGGVPVTSVMIAESVEILEEKYLCFLLDRSMAGPICIASPAGGVDIEEVAEKTPEKVKTLGIDIAKGKMYSCLEKIWDNQETFNKFRRPINLFYQFNLIN